MSDDAQDEELQLKKGTVSLAPLPQLHVDIPAPFTNGNGVATAISAQLGTATPAGADLEMATLSAQVYSRVYTHVYITLWTQMSI